MAESREYCAELSAANNEPMAGTAPQVDVWLLLEYAPTWKAKAIQDNALAAATTAWIGDMERRVHDAGLKPRVQFIRRPELDHPETTLFIARDQQLYRAQATGYDALRDIDPLETNLEAVNEPTYFVCTNGQRDLCCARFGRQAYVALRERVGGRVWQTTHVGGHRYAPNVLVLPQAALYGRIFSDTVDEFLSATEHNRLAPSFLRGRSAYPDTAQAAESALLHPGKLVEINDAQVVFDGGPTGRQCVRVTRQTSSTQMIPSCGVVEPKSIHHFEITLEAGH